MSTTKAACYALAIAATWCVGVVAIVYFIVR